RGLGQYGNPGRRPQTSDPAGTAARGKWAWVLLLRKYLYIKLRFSFRTRHDLLGFSLGGGARISAPAIRAYHGIRAGQYRLLVTLRGKAALRVGYRSRRRHGLGHRRLRIRQAAQP